MTIPFLQPGPEDAQGLRLSLERALQDLSEKYKGAVMYGAHLNALLREACDHLENLEVTVDVSEPLAYWWEMEKRKRQAANSTLVSADGTPIGRRVGPDRGSPVGESEFLAGESVVSEDVPITEGELIND